MLHRLIGEDITLHTDLAFGVGIIKADRGQVEQVIMNLAVNARDAMPSGGKLMLETQHVDLSEEYVRHHKGAKPGSYVMLAVTDTGTGMDAATRARIFEPFFTTKEAGKGTGLGLSTVYGIVKQSGGSIWVYSEMGHGTTFKVYLPVVVESSPANLQKNKSPKAVRGTETVLLTEDDDLVRALANRVLATFGYQVLEAATVGAAIALCEKHPERIHLLVTDVIMPEMNGRELSNHLTNLRPDMKILFMSGYTDKAIVHQQILDEKIHFIQKPFAPQAFVKKVREVLDSG
jgi:CheY-like chemotaxis protein